MWNKIKLKQQGLLLTIIGVLTLALVSVSILWWRVETQRPQPHKNPTKSLTTGANRVNLQEVWVHEFTQKADLTQKRLEALEQMVENLLKMNVAPKTPSLGLNASDNDTEQLRQELKNLQTIDAPHRPNSPQPTLLPPAPTTSESLSIKSLFKSSEVKKIVLSLRQNRSHQPLKTTDNTLPAGAFARAILLGGVDASTSIQASSDPRPVLLRLTDPGTLPRRFRSDVEGCHVLAAGYGDLSSERVFMRLEKLSCVERKTGEVIEINVQGYVAGEDGRAGVRGVMVDKAGPVMRNAMMGGFFSSVGKFLSQARTPFLFSPATGLAQNNPLTSHDLLKQSAANGAGGALDKYADFYIKRAEQMQPVIQVAAGRKVDIVLTQGLDFSESAVRKAVSKTNDQKRFSQIQRLEESKPVQPWSPSSEEILP